MNEFLRGYRPENAPEIKVEKIQSPESREQKAEAIAAQMTDLVREYGVDALKEMLAKMQQAVDEGRGVQAKELVEVIETRPGRSEFQKKALEAFEQLGYVETLNDGTLVVDDKKLLTKFSLAKLRNLSGEPFADFEDYRSNRMSFLANTFAGKKVFLKDELSNHPEAEPKPLFYLPETRQDSLDLQQIHSAEFHHGLWEVSGATRSDYYFGLWKDNKVTTNADPQAVEIEQPASLTEQNYFETTLAALIYHPKYGNAHRNEEGQLLLEIDGKEKPITGKWLADQGLKFSVDGTPQALRDNPKEVIKKYAPHLLEKQLLRLSDFAIERSHHRTQEARKISSNGVVSIDGVKHYLGRQYAGRSLRIDQIGDGSAALIELDEHGQGTPIGMIDVYAKGDSRLTERKTNTGAFYEAGGKLTHPRAFDEAEYQQPKPGENPDHFFIRKQKFEAFKTVLDFDNALKQEGDVALFDISPELQQELQEHANNIARHKDLYLSFADTFGKDGLEIVAAIAESTALSEQILTATLNLPVAERNSLLPKLHEALLARHNALNALNDRKEMGLVTDLEYRKVTFEINRRITTLLTAAEDSAAIRESVSTPDKKLALDKLAKQGNELVLFSKIFKGAFKGTEKMDFEQMRGLSIVSERATELDNDTRQDMIAIFEENWRGQKPEVLADLRKGFVEKLTNSESTQFRILKKDGRVVAFIRFDERPDLQPGAVYGGSLNVDPSLRGSAVGEAMMKAIIDEVAKNHTIYADVFPDLVVGTKYVEDLGCVITGVEEVQFGKNTQPVKRLLLKRDDRENLSYRHGNKNAVTVTVDMRKGVNELTHVIEQQTRGGKVATRYFSDPQNPNLRTLVFEPQAQTEGLPLAAK